MLAGRVEVKGFIGDSLSFSNTVDSIKAVDHILAITCEYINKYEFICDNDDDYIDLSLEYGKNKDVIVTRRY